MLIISDGGSSKADWKIYDQQATRMVTTTGFNPNYATGEQIAALLKEELGHDDATVQESTLHYYGAGCWDPGRKSVVAKAIASIFPRAEIHVHHDLLAAARATCGDEPGIACILGTGSNSVLYDGVDEVDNVTNLGFLLGDEGSGAHIGKSLVKAFFYREMPPELCEVMEAACPNGRKDILDNIYNKDSLPAAYMASFSERFSQYHAHPFINDLIKDCFLEFLKRHVCKYKNHENLPIHFVGSVAFHSKGILKQALDELGLNMGNVIKKPIDNLLDYHLEKMALSI